MRASSYVNIHAVLENIHAFRMRKHMNNKVLYREIEQKFIYILREERKKNAFDMQLEFIK